MASFGILANKDRLEAEIAEAKKSVTRQRRIDRELKKVQSGGRVSSFLKREAEKNEVLSASVALAAANDPLSYGNALINYQNSINPVNISDDLKTENVPVPKIPEEGGGIATIPPHPWQILLRLNEDGDPEFKVELNSVLYSGLGTGSPVTITGLNIWNLANVGYIVLSGTVSSGMATGAEISGPVETLPERVVYSVDSEQTGFSVQLGYLFFQDGQIAVRQNAFHNFTLFDLCISGKPSIYPIAT